MPVGWQRGPLLYVGVPSAVARSTVARLLTDVNSIFMQIGRPVPPLGTLRMGTEVPRSMGSATDGYF